MDSNLKADIAGQKADLKIISKTEGILTIPDGVEVGLGTVKFTKGGKEIALIPLIIGDYSEDLPLITAAADKVCNDIIFKDQAGKLSRGTRAGHKNAP